MMEFEDYLIKIINTPYFQRLRHLKQLGGVEYVYPGGNHSRFSHSLGVCYLAGRVLDTLQSHHEDPFDENDSKHVRVALFDENDRKCVRIAALCHDIGHGPFSHLYESIANELDGDGWSHEDKSTEILDEVLEKLNYQKKDREFIKDMIKGKSVKDMTEDELKKAFLYQIVNNKDNGVDVDKWDYFTRDSHACGFKKSFDTERTIMMIRVREKTIDGKKAKVLCFRDKDRLNLYSMFYTRYILHSKVYQHPVARCIEQMIADALKFVDNEPILKINGKSTSSSDCRKKGNIEEYCLLNDSFLHTIYCTADTDNDKQIAAKKLVGRINERDFYYVIYNIPFKEPMEKPTIKQMKKVLKEEIPKQLAKKEEIAKLLEKEDETGKETEQNSEKGEGIDKANREEILKDKFRVQIISINYGNGTKDPVDKIQFYSKNEGDGDGIQDIESPMIPSCFQEVRLLVMCTQSKTKDSINEWKDFEPVIRSCIDEAKRRIVAADRGYE